MRRFLVFTSDQRMPETSQTLTQPSQPTTPDDTAATPHGLLQRAPWLREPLLHFVFLGALLFALDHAVSSRAEDPHTIVVSG